MEKRPYKPGSPDVEFTAAVKAKELRFDEVPDTEVHPPAQTERENLPERVRREHAGITFRDVSIRVRIADELSVDRPDGREEPSHVVEQSKERTGKEKK